jgi:hypothetical protein
MSTRYVLVKDNVVYNAILWDGNLETWQPPDDGTIAIQNSSAGIGDWWEESESRFYRPIQNDEEHNNVIEP